MKKRGHYRSIFPETMSYYMEKVWEGIRRPDLHEFSYLNLVHINEIIQEFKQQLEQDDLLDDRWGITFAFDELDYPIRQLQAYFKDSSASALKQNDASVFAFFIQEHIKQLQEMATEVDQELAQ